MRKFTEASVQKKKERKKYSLILISFITRFGIPLSAKPIYKKQKIKHDKIKKSMRIIRANE